MLDLVLNLTGGLVYQEAYQPHKDQLLNQMTELLYEVKKQLTLSSYHDWFEDLPVFLQLAQSP